MAFVFKFCSKCGKRFVNPSEDDFTDLCPNCREQGQVGMEINDTFSQEEVRKIMMGPNGQNTEEEVNIDDLFDNDDVDDDDLDYQEIDEPEYQDFDDDDYDE